MIRYTSKSLQAGIEVINQKLVAGGHKYLMVWGHRNGYNAIDLATPEELRRDCCTRMLVGGTPRECIAAAHEYFFANM